MAVLSSVAWAPKEVLACSPEAFSTLLLSSSFFPFLIDLDLKKIGGRKVIWVERAKRCQRLLCLTWF